MEYGHFDYSQPETTFPAPDPSHRVAPSYPLGHMQDYHHLDETPIAPDYGSYDPNPGLQNSPVEDGDGAGRTRLTQEQIAELEKEFAIKPKPNTEQKKTLADRMRVEYQRVNVSSCPHPMKSHVNIDLS